MTDIDALIEVIDALVASAGERFPDAGPLDDSQEFRAVLIKGRKVIREQQAEIKRLQATIDEMLGTGPAAPFDLERETAADGAFVKPGHGLKALARKVIAEQQPLELPALAALVEKLASEAAECTD